MANDNVSHATWICMSCGEPNRYNWNKCHNCEADATPGQLAASYVAEADRILADPTKARWHEDLKRARDRMQNEIDFWNALADSMFEDDE